MLPWLSHKQLVSIYSDAICVLNNSKMPNNTINEKNGSKIRLQQLATIVREYLALRLSEMLLKYSRYHGQEDLSRRGSRGGEMGEFSPPLFLSIFFLFFLSLKCWPQTPQPGFGSIILLQKFTPHFKILDPRLLRLAISKATDRV